MDGTMDLTGKTELELRAMERAIAKQHLDKFPYLSLIWAFGNLACWIAVWVLCPQRCDPALVGLYHCDSQCSGLLPAIS
jgi:beta-carotene hydroxylase